MTPGGQAVAGSSIDRLPAVGLQLPVQTQRWRKRWMPAALCRSWLLAMEEHEQERFFTCDCWEKAITMAHICGTQLKSASCPICDRAAASIQGRLVCGQTTRLGCHASHQPILLVAGQGDSSLPAVWRMTPILTCGGEISI